MKFSKPAWPFVFLLTAAFLTFANIIPVEAAKLTLSWIDNSTTENGFQINRVDPDGTLVPLATVGANITSYTDSQLRGGFTYCYAVRAFNGSGFSNVSNTACGTAANTSGPTQRPDGTLEGLTSYADYDGDSQADYTVFRDGNWYIIRSTDDQLSSFNFGAGAQYIPVPADYDGDGRTDVAVYDRQTGDWYINQSTAGFRSQLKFGGPDFIPVPGDYDGDNVADVAVYQISTGHWFFVGSTTGFGQTLWFGGAGYIPVPADYDGDGKTDPAVYDSINGHWYIERSNLGLAIHPRFGGGGYVPLPGDYDGDGKADIAVYHSSEGDWFWYGSSSGFYQHLNFGGPNFDPVPADYDGDGLTDTALYDRGSGNWLIYQSTDGFMMYPSFGGNGFAPVLPQLVILRAMGAL